MKQFCKWWLCVFVIFGIASGVTSAQDEWMPDANLRQAVREALELSDEIPLTQPIMNQLTRLDAADGQITDLTGLEHAINLTWLHLGVNEIQDISPLAELERLEALWIYVNPLSDITPLASLVNLKTLDFGVCQITNVHPLANLKELEILRLDSNLIEDIAPLSNLMMLTELGLADNRIVDISSLADLTNLEILRLHYNQIQDITPLANLTSLRELWLTGNRIVGISPLENLTTLKELRIRHNQIRDITPLSNLTNLTELWLTGNRIVDIRPLENLTTLKELRIRQNPITDYGRIDTLSLTHFEYDKICELSGFPIQERVQNRSFPSVFRAWHGIINRPELSSEENYAYHDLSIVIEGEIFKMPGIYGVDPPYGFSIHGNLDRAKEIRAHIRSLNPNMLTIAAIPINFIGKDTYPDDWPYWLRDRNGNRVYEPFSGSGLIDFTLTGAQDWVVERAKAVARCGLYDGIFFDNWRAEDEMLGDPQTGEVYRPVQDEYDAKESILTRIREYVDDNFLILVNSNRSKIPRSAPYVNGIFMETVRDYEGGYTYAGLREIENTLLWAEENLRSPQVNCLEGWGVETEVPDSPTNLRWMRAFTAMSLTHSDGYVLHITTTNRHPDHEHNWDVFDITHREEHDQGIGHNHDHDHYWYDFWDADLGKPIAEKAQLYENREGLFIREFTNGWAVYNRSGSAQEIRLPEQGTGVESGLQNTLHSVPDLDGEIYLKSKTDRHDVNGDGIVNILDLVAVANGLGTDAPDVNGDGVVNILDLVAVANAFGQ